MGNRVENVFDKETSLRMLEIVNSWIRAADSKTSILVAFIGLIVGLSASTYGKLSELLVNGSIPLITIVIVFGLAYLVILGLTIFNLVSVFIARTKNVDIFSDNLFSFVSIAEMDDEDFIKETKEVDEKKAREMILSQISINSKIAISKMRYFNDALKYGIALIPLTIVLMLLAG
ncbi:hypothetical protein HF295_04480 [Hujiaoplasma nucleasis]|uniref:Pycsar effector protein domain-containing protein n=1 Tax=Hujiaoplasma nucleasis TaxID=2725268 RepID=A0A7L6N1L3_9MOLU|nr:hypothetical protein [Hujiaoplasma nucleasis]QLY40156.1 hypothetical protein HF295_04480 [Hujiaoplasma nucleasis]